MGFLILRVLAFTVGLAASLKFDPEHIDYNLNQNRSATEVRDYWGEWPSHTFHPSPENWRFPFYTFFLDRLVNGDATNDDKNGTVFEHDVTGNQLRHGGDLAGLVDTLDYIQGMGIKGLYIAGTPFINFPWKSDQYSPLDMSLLDGHFGDIQTWRTTIDEIHKRGMYVLLDNVMATMGDLIGFDGHLNQSTPFNPEEYKVQYKSQRRYHDFVFENNDYIPKVEYPRFWNISGHRVLQASDDPSKVADFSKLVGRYNGEFDQYGDTEGFGNFPDWQRQLSKFSSAQDRLREWVPSVREKLEVFGCMTIAMLDIDGFRFDKGLQVTVDAQAEYGATMRKCARRFGKKNFFMAGEITGGNGIGSIYIGRGREPEMVPENITAALTLKETDRRHFIRDIGKNAFDGAAFHYSIYRSLTRFLGMDGNVTIGYDVPVDFTTAWNIMLTTNDMINAETGIFDPRHMYGVTNQDVFRWPSIKDGTHKMLLGLYITTLHLPGIPKLLWGEEQAFYLLDNTASNYVFGRQPMSSSVAWQSHGCYRLGAEQYYQFPVDSALNGCNDDDVSLDHRDPTHPVRNIIKSMYHLRQNYPLLNEGYLLQSLSKQTHDVHLPGSNGSNTPATETGMWSVLRDQHHDIQKFRGEQPVWLVYQNDNRTREYTFDCSSADALISAFDAGTTVKNLLAPYEELTLKRSPQKLGIDGSEKFNGCLDSLKLDPYGFKAYVPKAAWLPPPPMLTRFSPGHDARLLSKVRSDQKEVVDIELHFSEEMDCDGVTESLDFSSTTEENGQAALQQGSIACTTATDESTKFSGEVPTVWKWKAKLLVSNGVHTVTVRKGAPTKDAGRLTDSVDHLMFRVGQVDNPMVFPRRANYSQDALSKNPTTKALQVSHKAAGADLWRYSTNWGSSWSDWTKYTGGISPISPQDWSGTKRQRWHGEHIILQYWGKKTGSSNHIQHADADWKDKPQRRFPHLFAHGPFNEFGFDAGLRNSMDLGSDGEWKFHLMTEWPSKVQLNVWGMNPDGKPDQTFVFGDVTNDTVIDRMPPDALAQNFLNLSAYPPSPHLAYRVELNDANLKYRVVPVGRRLDQIILFALLWSIPISTGVISIWTYMGAFYGVKFNKIGVMKNKNLLLPAFFRRKFEKIPEHDDDEHQTESKRRTLFLRPNASRSTLALPALATSQKRRTVLIATMEYDIEDWAIKIKIGGLGVMAQLMGKNLEHQDLIWVVPCVGGVDYPTDTPAPSMDITILGKSYEVQVQYHRLKNITYVLLDAPIFRQQSKTEPYPPRMDDLDSAVYYSAWNACIALTIRRFPVDIYHINDYHGAAAPLYLLPETIPCCLSLHNAEFQGLWPMRTPEEQDEVAKVYNLPMDIVEKYVQFGQVFNLLHAGASYLRSHQRGFGAVGVSKKYGARSYARYPIFWGLKEIGSLPNPDPTDLAPLSPEGEKPPITVDSAFEAGRADLRRQAQEWAHLDVNPKSELFVFVGRWSVQKGIDLIADVFPAVLDKHPNVQLICVGPVIDLYGKFAALKLGEMMKKYPGRVYSKPEFTALPPYIFSGAEFALIPSRDEPFGLVAVEFGRKGALGVGARVGGLGQMPGWWYTVESTTNKHLQHQFISAIDDALKSKTEARAMMRALSAKQRFPVAQWVKDLDILQSTSIKIHQEEVGTRPRPVSRSRAPSPPIITQPLDLNPADTSASGLNRTLSLGVRHGPGRGKGAMKAPTPIREDEDNESIIGRFSDNPEVTITLEQAENMISPIQTRRPAVMFPTREDDERRGQDRSRGFPDQGRLLPDARQRSLSPSAADNLLSSSDRWDGRSHSRSSGESIGMQRLARNSVLSLSEVVGTKHDFKLQKVDPTFNDSQGEYYAAFEAMLQKSSNLSSDDLCVGDYLDTSEKAWFKKMRAARLGRQSREHLHGGGSRPSSAQGRPVSRPQSTYSNYGTDDENGDDLSIRDDVSMADEFLLGEHYQRPSIVKRWLLTRIGDWPIYSLLLGLGQIMSVNSYQITILTGSQGNTPEKLYIVGGVFMAFSCIWWLTFRSLKSAYVLSLPWLFYGSAFAAVGIAPFLPVGAGRDWTRNVAVGLYTAAASSGSIYFALNFGDEGGAPIKSWVFRACLIQGTQQVYITALFYWGSTLLTGTTETNRPRSTLDSRIVMPAITLPIMAICFVIAVVLFTSLPSYYHQSPGKTPYFYKALLRRKIIGWFFITIVLQNYFLSSPYGRNWNYLWSSQHAPAWAVAVLAVVFFVGVWSLILFIFGRLSKSHSWILPIFAIGLGAPRWCQMLWGTSSYGLWLPWMPGGPIAGALAGRSLWLWLGVLDSIQGVGFGMMLLNTLTRLHIAVTLIIGQFLGAGITLIAKATAPNRDGPGDVFPDFSAGVAEALMKPWFWVALVAQMVIPVGFFLVFRKAQLSKP